MSRAPTGFVAICQCGELVGAMDLTRTERAEAGKLIGRWLFSGCTVQPRFSGEWSAVISGCKCQPADQKGGE